MKCPFELPVKATVSTVDTDKRYISSLDYKTFVCGDVNKEYADYIVTVINSHRNLEMYKEYVETRISENMIPMCYEKWNFHVEELAKELEQSRSGDVK